MSTIPTTPGPYWFRAQPSDQWEQLEIVKRKEDIRIYYAGGDFSLEYFWEHFCGPSCEFSPALNPDQVAAAFKQAVAKIGMKKSIDE